MPIFEQEIPPEKLEEISGKIAVREHEQALALTAKLEQQFASDRAKADAKAQADLDLERQQSAIREAAARDEAQKTAEATANEKLAAAEKSRQAMQAALQNQLANAETARKAAEQAGTTLQLQYQRLQQDSERALTEAKADAKARESDIRTEAQQLAQAAVAGQLAVLENARLEAETAKHAAEQTGAALQLQIDELGRTKDAEIAKVRADAANEANRIRLEAIAVTETSMRATITAHEQAAVAAMAKAQDAEGKLAVLTDQHDAIMNERLNEQREILEKAKSDEINAVKAKAFEENQRQVDKLTEMQRALEKKTNEELGEGAEIDLFESLKAEFPDDRITRIGKGVQGAGVLHVVMLNGKACGTIIYDSKNHGQFRSDHVTKLRTDQIAAKAEHAILSTRKFPAKASQLHIEDGVLLANPARVVALVTVIRQHMVQTHTLRMSGAERESKTEALYDFITSDRYTQFLSRVDANAQELLDLQVKEKKAHDAAWKKEGELIKQIQRVQAGLSNEISCIIGTAADDAPDFEGTDLLQNVDEGAPLIAGSQQRSDAGRRSGKIRLIDQL